MKDSHKCPKCKTATVVYVPEPTDRSWGRRSLHSEAGGFSTVHVCPLEAYVCSKCGYTELYATELDGLQRIPGAMECEADPEPPPYR